MRLVAVGFDACRVGQIGSGGNAGSLRIARILEEILHRSALHAAVGTPWTHRVGVALVVAIILRIGVDDDADGAALLGDVDLHAAEIRAVADDYDLAVQVDLLFREFVEVFEPAVVCVDRFARHVA